MTGLMSNRKDSYGILLLISSAEARMDRGRAEREYKTTRFSLLFRVRKGLMRIYIPPDYVRLMQVV